MPYIIEIDGHFIGPFITEAGAEERIKQELAVLGAETTAALHFVLPPHWVAPGGPYSVPFVIIKEDGTEHYPYGKHATVDDLARWLNLDGL